ncbi:MAG: hypothetical protein JWN34_790 [Bryobacterales bacterium]|nr:hypothetical protein [Bryobacterales bacterium]
MRSLSLNLCSDSELTHYCVLCQLEVRAVFAIFAWRGCISGVCVKDLQLVADSACNHVALDFGNHSST